MSVDLFKNFQSAGIFRLDDWPQLVKSVPVMTYVIIASKGKPVTGGKPWKVRCEYAGHSGAINSDGTMCYALDEKKPGSFYNESAPFERAKEHRRHYENAWKIVSGQILLEDTYFPQKPTDKEWRQFHKYLSVFRTEESYTYDDLWVEVFVPKVIHSHGWHNTFGRAMEDFIIENYARIHGMAPLGNIEHLPPDVVTKMFGGPAKMTRALEQASKMQSLVGFFH